jgi:hypothetical protein
MPNPTSPPTSLQPSAPNSLQCGPFRERMILCLLPHFLTVAANFDDARAEALETLASYGARTRAEVINAVRIIAFSFASLDLLGEATAEGVTPAMRLRYCGGANSLNRACQQDEKSLAKRLARELTQPAEPASDPLDDMTDAELAAAIEQARAQIDNARAHSRGPVPAARAIPAPSQDPNQPPWNHPMIISPVTPFQHASPA